MPTNTNPGLYRVANMHGSALRDGKILAEAVEVAATVAIGRIDVVLAGTTRTGYKPGRSTREGTLTVQHIDTKWEMEVYNAFLSRTDEERRALRGTGVGTLKPFQLQLEFNDPDALGYETWQLDGCLLWALPLGFSAADDSVVNREFPLTWESERPLAHFEQTGNTNPVTGMPAVNQVDASTPQ